jgi:hypothetical protein
MAMQEGLSTRWGSRSEPSRNGHLHYPNDIDRSLNEVATDKIRKYDTEYNMNIITIPQHYLLDPCYS